MRAAAWRVLTAIAFAGVTGAAAEPKHVAITAFVEHPALDAVRDGVMKGLVEAGYTEGVDVTFSYAAAHGNPATAAQIARRLASSAPDVIVAISTPSAQAAAAATKEIPIVFSAVTDPIAARLVASAARPAGNITGVSDKAPIGEHVALIREITPAARRLGVLFNPGEVNSVSSLAALKSEASRVGILVVEAQAFTSADVEAATRALIGQVDAIYVPTDNTIVAVLETAVGVANGARMPLYAGDTESVARGAVAALGFNYSDVGVQTAGLVDRVLKGEAPSEIAVIFASGTDLHVNKAAAAAIGLEFPPPVLRRAAKVIE